MSSAIRQVFSYILTSVYKRLTYICTASEVHVYVLPKSCLIWTRLCRKRLNIQIYIWGILKNVLKYLYAQIFCASIVVAECLTFSLIVNWHRKLTAIRRCFIALFIRLIIRSCLVSRPCTCQASKVGDQRARRFYIGKPYTVLTEGYTHASRHHYVLYKLRAMG